MVKKHNLPLILITAIAFISLCSHSSPLYPFNTWVDPNCFVTVGKSMLHGLVPYRDLVEQKGPLLYMLHALTAIVSFKTFLGVYLLEIIAAIGFLYYGFKAARLYNPSVSSLVIPVTAALVYSARCFVQGDSVEELCLPIYAYAIYVGLKALKEDRPLSSKECLAIGITAACVLWMKFSVLGLYLGLFAIFCYQAYKRKELAEVYRMVGWIGLGVVIVTTPILVYFAANNALSDLFEVYFYDNICYFTRHSSIPGLSLFNGLRNGAARTMEANSVTAILLICCLWELYRSKKYTPLAFIGLTAATTFFLVFCGGRYSVYYPFILCAFIPFVLSVFYTAIREHGLRINISARAKHVLVFSLCLCYAVYISDNIRYLIRYNNRDDYPQYQFADIINKKPDATLLNYGFLDGGFYTTTGIIPANKYFCKLNIPLCEMMQEQDSIVNNGCVDFVVTRDNELDAPQYELIKTSSIEDIYSQMYDFYLYELKQ